MRAPAAAAPEGSPIRIEARRMLVNSAYRWFDRRSFTTDPRDEGQARAAWMRHARTNLAALVGVVGELELERIALAAWTMR